MSHSSVPVSPRWRTVAADRTVLAVIHNITAATRLLDVVSLFAEDPRIQVMFTCPGSSAFTHGTDEFLTARGISLLPWETAKATEFDWAVSASYGGDLHELRAPLTVVPHGMGYNKYLEIGNRKSEIGNRKSVFGLSTPWLMHGGKVVADHIVLSHDEQLDRLRLSCPSAVRNAVVAGDPCLDRLRASLPLREAYRQAFGVRPGQRLVLVSSTWGSRSLYGTDPTWPARIAEQLPLDEFAVLLALHPNIGQGHLRWQLDQWLARCRRGGVTVLDREELWQQAVVAADVTIGDQGSVTFYSACLGVPVLLATAPHDTVDLASPVAALLRTAPELTGEDLARQLTGVIESPPDLSTVTSLATSAPGQSAAKLTELGYRVLRLPPPAKTPALSTFPMPGSARAEPEAQWVSVRGDKVIRRAATGADYPPDALLVVTTDAPDPRLLERADVVLGRHLPDPVRWIAATLRALPGCRWAACPAGAGWVAGNSAGLLVEFTATELPHVVPAVLCAHDPVISAEIRFTVAGRPLRASVATLLDDRSPSRRPSSQ